MSNWRDDEIRELLSVRADADIIRQIQGTARDSVVYDQITNRLRDRDVIRAKPQVINKLKTLKKQYHQVVDYNNGRSGDDRKTWPYFSLCEAIWGSNHSTNPVALVGSMETTSRSPETLSTIDIKPTISTIDIKPTISTIDIKPTISTIDIKPTISTPMFPETPSTSSCAETPYSDTEEQKTVYETDVSINDSVLSTESPCRSPPKKKRRTQTRSERLSADIRDLFSEMDKDFNERERLRLSEQREYEERVRREARAEKAQEMAVLQDMTSLLRQMVQQMPARPPHNSFPSGKVSLELCSECSKGISMKMSTSA